MTKWRCVSAVLVLDLVVGCATAVNDTPAVGGDTSAGGSAIAAVSGGDGSTVGGSSTVDSPLPGSSGTGALAFGGGTGVPVAGASGASGAAGASSFGGSSGTSSAGSSAGGASGGSAGADMSGSGGATNTGPCANPMGVSKGNSGNFGTVGAVCLRTKETFNTVGCSNFAGRTFKVNGVAAKCDVKGTFAPAIDLYNYFDISAGSVPYASIAWYTS